MDDYKNYQTSYLNLTCKNRRSVIFKLVLALIMPYLKDTRTFEVRQEYKLEARVKTIKRGIIPTAVLKLS